MLLKSDQSDSDAQLYNYVAVLPTISVHDEEPDSQHACLFHAVDNFHGVSFPPPPCAVL